MYCATNQTLKIKLGASKTTNDMPWVATSITTTYIQYTTDGTTNGTSDVTIVAAGTGFLKSFVINNLDTVAQTLFIIYDNNGTQRIIAKALLSIGGYLEYNSHTGFKVYDSNGSLRTSSIIAHSTLIGLDYESSGHTGFASSSSLNSLSGDSASLSRSNTFTNSLNIFQGSLNVNQNLTVTGTMTVAGSAFVVNQEHVLANDNIITVNANETGSGVTSLSAGIEVERGTQPNYYFVFNETDGAFKIGQANSLQKVATRENTPNTNSIMYWDDGTNSLKTSANFLYNNGKVGIGTTSSLIGETLGVKVQSGKTVGFAVSTNDFTTSSIGTIFGVSFGDISGSTYTSLGSYIDGANAWGNIIMCKDGGRLGIGTPTPGSKLSIVGLPTSASGLSAGDVWNDNGTLKIVT